MEIYGSIEEIKSVIKGVGMKKSDIEKRLKRDLQSATPANFDAVWKRCERADVAVGGLRESATERSLVAAGAQGGTRCVGG